MVFSSSYSSKAVRLCCLCKFFQVLNQIVYELPEEHPLSETKPLREILGHTVPQVELNALNYLP
jgi:acid phosphatase family membrane protein YuiD